MGNVSLYLKVALLLSFQLLFQDCNSRAIIETSSNRSPKWINKHHYTQDEPEQKNLTLLYSDASVDFYINSKITPTQNETLQQQWNYPIFSKMWNYINTVYNLLPPETNPRLEITIHSEKENTLLEIRSLSNSTEQQEFPQIIEFACGQNKEVLCDISTLTEGIIHVIWNLATQSQIADLEQESESELVENASGRKARLQGIPVPQSNDAYSNWRIWSIILYDVYIGIQKETQSKKALELAENFIVEESNVVTDFPSKGTHLFRDFYLPVYQIYGGSETIQSFFNNINFYMMLYGNGNQGESDSKIKMNPGIFVHFWSGATGKDLRDLAEKAFGWPEEFEMQFEEAQNTFPFLKYTSGSQAVEEIEKESAEKDDEIAFDFRMNFEQEEAEEEKENEPEIRTESFETLTSTEKSLESSQNSLLTEINEKITDAWKSSPILVVEIVVALNALILFVLTVLFLVYFKKLAVVRRRICGHTAEEVDGLMGSQTPEQKRSSPSVQTV